MTHANEHVAPKEKQNFKCKSCGLVTETKATLNRHIQTNPKILKVNIDERIELPCDQCDYKATAQSNLRYHVRGIHEKVLLSCSLCSFKATWKRNIRRHIQNKHDSVSYLYPIRKQSLNPK